MHLDESLEFLRTERNLIAHEAPSKIGQKIYGATIGSSEPAYQPSSAAEFYFFGDPNESVIETVNRHLERAAVAIAEADQELSESKD